MESPPALSESSKAGAGAVGVAGGRITARSVLLGMFLTIFIALVTPYNDNICHNTYMVGNHLPVVVVGVITLLCVVINPVLGARRFTTAEMGMGVGMMVISCALPSSGFWRYFQPLLADTVLFSKERTWYGEYLKVLPDWMLPSKDAGSSIVQAFYIGLDRPRGESLGGTWQQWLVPYASWAFFILPMLLAVVMFAAVMRKQWVVHERLAFPLAAIPMEMMAPAEGTGWAGRWNGLWRSRLLWIGVAIPLFIHMVNGASVFYTQVPKIPVFYDIHAALTEYPWRNLPDDIKTATVYFSVVGVTFFVPLEISFSLWAFYIGYKLISLWLDAAGVPVTWENQTYQGLGIFTAYGLLMLWLARHHLWHVMKSIGKPRENQEYLAYGTNLGILGGCMVVAAGFLACAYGSLWSVGNWALGLLTVAILLFYGMVLTRMVIDAGVLLVQVPAGAEAIRLLGLIFKANTHVLTLRQWMVSTFATQLALTDQREAWMPFAANSLRLGSLVKPQQRTKYLGMVLLALVLCWLASGMTHHMLSYVYGRQDFDDGHGPYRFPRLTMDLAHENADPQQVPSHINRPLNVGYGAAAIVVVGVLRALFVSCPLHPIGLLMLNNWGEGQIWFSIFLSWLAKFVILRWGGARAYTRAREFFIGLIVGESLAGLFWIIVGFMTVWPDPHNPFRVLSH